MLMPEMVVGRQRTVVAGGSDLGGSAGGRRRLRLTELRWMAVVGTETEDDGGADGDGAARAKPPPPPPPVG